MFGRSSQGMIAEIDAFIAAVKSCSTPPLPPRAELEEIAGKISASPAEIGLVWLGGLNLSSYQSNFLPAELRTALGLKAAEVNAGRQALSNFDPSVLNQLYESVVSQGCAAPFAADRKPTLDLIEKAWRAHMPQRFQMDAALQPRPGGAGQDVAVAANAPSGASRPRRGSSESSAPGAARDRDHRHEERGVRMFAAHHQEQG